MESQSRWLELKVMDCKDLKAFNFFQKLSVYALVCLVNNNHPSQKKLEQQQRTPTDTQGDTNPEWNHQMRFDLGLLGGRQHRTSGDDDDDDDDLFLHFDLRSELAIFGDKSVGEVLVMLKDLINNNNKEEEHQFSSGIVRFVSYEVRTSDGKPNGVLSFSYRLLTNKYDGDGAASIGNSTLNLEANSSNNNNNVQIDGYPILSHIIQPLPLPLPLPLPSEVQYHSSSSSFPSNSHVHYPSLLPEDYSVQSQQSYYSASAAAAGGAPHQFHHPSLETPDSASPPPSGNGYNINYPPAPAPPDYDQFHYPPPLPPTAVVLPLPLPPPFLPQPPPPPPPPHVGQGVVYHQPQSPWVYEQPYPKPPPHLLYPRRYEW